MYSSLGLIFHILGDFFIFFFCFVLAQQNVADRRKSPTSFYFKIAMTSFLFRIVCCRVPLSFEFLILPTLKKKRN
jgi:hypothetical protein